MEHEVSRQFAAQVDFCTGVSALLGSAGRMVTAAIKPVRVPRRFWVQSFISLPCLSVHGGI
jgi:hypothetical protein